MAGKRTPGVIAGQAFEKIRKLNDACEREIATAPDSIRARYDERIARILESVDDSDAAVLLGKMLGSDLCGDEPEETR